MLRRCDSALDSQAQAGIAAINLLGLIVTVKNRGLPLMWWTSEEEALDIAVNGI